MIAFTGYCSDGRVRREAEALVERGDTVDCIAFAAKSVPWLCGVRLLSCSDQRYRGTNPFALLLAYIRFFSYAFFKVSVMHLARPYDIVQVHTMPDFLVFAAFIPKVLGAKVILDVHDLMPEIYAAKFSGPRTRFLITLLSWIERLSIAFADAAMCVHKPHLDALLQHGNPASKFTIVLNAPDPRIFFLQKRSAGRNYRFRLFYHGSTPKRAGLDIALRALVQARKEIPNIEFQIVGLSERRECVERLVHELGLRDCVSILPVMPIHELPSLIAQADIGVIPYLSDAFTPYVLPTKLMEYSALGLPVITSRLRTIETYFDSTMVAFVEPGDAAELAEQIVTLYRSPDTAASLATNAARVVEQYSWPQQRQIYFRLVDSLLPPSDTALKYEVRG
jgi:glycosyltransferase involved in cell wall biosynthesis